MCKIDLFEYILLYQIFGFSKLYETYSNVALSLRSSIGKILLKTLSKPFDKSPASESKSA